jgi:hypothetical protein
MEEVEQITLAFFSNPIVLAKVPGPSLQLGLPLQVQT